ncbi:unnamed protein product [Rhizophagus irregularis]|nr:unnamed protein product [Rhizophagus irregularis]
MFNAHIHFKEIKNDLLNLFINNNTKFTHLYIYQQFNRQIHLIPESKQCFSDIKFLSCNASIDDYVLIGLIEMCESIKELEIFIEKGNKNYGIINLIKSSKKLFNISLIRTEFSFSKYSRNDESMESFFEYKHPMLLKFFRMKIVSEYVDLVERYKIEGVVKKFDHDLYGEDFEWI